MNKEVNSAQWLIDMCWHLTVLVAVFIAGSLITGGAFAASDNAISGVFCAVVDTLDGPTGAAVATVAVIAVGVGALLGKISWGMALIVAVGVALVFGASTIVSVLASGAGGSTGGGCGTTTTR